MLLQLYWWSAVWVPFSPFHPGAKAAPWVILSYSVHFISIALDLCWFLSSFALHSEASGFLWCSPLSCVMSPSPSLTRKIHKDGATFLGVAGMTEVLIIWSRFLILSTLELLCCPLKLASSLWGDFQSCAESLLLTTVLFPTHWIKLC